MKGEEHTVYCGTMGTRVHDISPVGRTLVSSDVLRTATAMEHRAKEEKPVSGLAPRLNPRLTPDGTEVVVTDATERGGSDYSVYAQKMSGGMPIRIGGGGYGTDVSDDGKWVLVVLPGEAKGKVQVIPVGAGEAQSLQWEGFEVVWANWFPDSQHILLRGNPAGQPVGLYETDRSGSAPKMLVKDVPGWADVMPDGENLLLLVGDMLVKRSLKDGSETKMRTLEPGETPVDWAKEPNHLYTQIAGATNVQMFKVSREREEGVVADDRAEGSGRGAAGDGGGDDNAGWEVDDGELCGSVGGVLYE